MSFLAMDAPRHTKLRGLVSAAFTPRQVARIEDGIRANAQADRRGGGADRRRRLRRADRQAAAAGDDLGHDRRARGRPRARRRGRRPARHGRRPGGVRRQGSPIEVLGEALWTLTEFANELAAHREQHPGDDLMTALVQAEVDGERLTHAEIAAFFVLLSVAGNDTTRHTTSHAMRALTRQPRPARAAARGSRRAAAGRRRGVRALGLAGADVPPHHDRARSSCTARRCRPARRSCSSTTRATATRGVR